MKILQLLSSNIYSGAENVVCQIINMFKDNEEIEMYYCSPDGQIREALKEKKIKFIPIKKVSTFYLNKIIKEYEIDLIHAHDVRASFIASTINKKIPIISHIHGNHIYMRKRTIKSVLYNIKSHKFSHIFYVSDSVYNDYKYKNKIKNKSSVLYNVIDENEIINKTKEDQNNYSYDVIFLGRLIEAKDPIRMIKILNNVISLRKNTNCAIVGNGEYYDKMKEYIEENHLNSNIQMYGYQSHPYKILNSSKVMIMTSIHEGLPMVVLEAMSLGIPIVSTPTDGIATIFNNDYKYIVKEDKDLINGIILLLDNENLREDALNYVKNRFKNFNSLKRYKEILFKKYMELERNKDENINVY